ncbi:HD domain-containing phosphohydrolase [uncultured Desulfobacter sp.]|uniref:HD domain-containing phosphohydrolase n=1 Tax=uncultured Desulfobacter sp. TaxID=240139 RepID=UPI0029F534C9|nr:HD domain-containing phosphohydrolase [uncultured Desulfobacter sp.]
MDEKILSQYKNEISASFLDNLTGLYNHGIFQTLLEEEIKRAQRYGDPFSLALIDIDSFAAYNKQHSPTTGDQALIEIAKLIRDNLRDPDIASRFSEDSFAVILPKCSINEAYNALDRIRTSIERYKNKSLTVSIGTASCPMQAGNRDALIQKANEALIQAKLKGKNRICCLDEEQEDYTTENSKVLIVDDEPKNVKLLDAILKPFKYHVFKAYNGEDALSVIKSVDIDLVLLDVMMPVMDGFEVCRRIKQNEATRLIPIIMLTALDDTPSRIEGIEAGVDDFITKPPNRIELTARIKSLLRFNEMNKKLTHVESVIITMANAIEAKDAYTQGHIERVAGLCVELGKRMGLSEAQLDALWFSGILHDIGKIAVPTSILNKPGPLDDSEYEVMKTHAEAGYKICLPLEKILGGGLDAIRHHHEKLDGSGYPDGIKGDDISVVARILSIVDIFDALDSDRPYRESMPRSTILKILYEEANTGKLDITIVDHLAELLEHK